MHAKIKIFGAVSILAIGGFLFANSAGAQSSVEGRPCQRTDPYIYECTSEDSFTFYKCSHPDWPACVKTYQEADKQFYACVDEERAINERLDQTCLFPTANPFVDDDQEIAEEFADYQAECKKDAESGGWVSPCCGNLGIAQACSAKVSAARKVNDACRARTDFVYKAQYPVPCGGCTPGKIIGDGDLCYDKGAVPPVDTPISTLPVDQNSDSSEDDLRLAKFRSGVIAEAEKIIEVKKCPAPFSPSQNACVDDKLAQMTDTGYFGMKTKIKIGYSKPVSATERFMIDMMMRPDKSQLEVEIDMVNLMIERATGQLQKQFDESYFGSKASSPLSNMQFAPATPISYKNLVVLDADPGADSKIIYEPQMAVASEWKSLNGGSEIAPNSLIVTDQKSVRLGSGTTVVEIAPGSGVVVGGYDNGDTQSAGPDFISVIQNTDGSSQADDASIFDIKFGGVIIDTDGGSANNMVITPLTVTKSKHTQFAVLYDPEGQYAATAIYEGEVEVTDRFTGETVTLKSADDGKPRILLVPLAQAQEASEQAVPAGDQSSGSAWLFIPLLLLLGGLGFWLYEKGVFKKFIINKPQL